MANDFIVKYFLSLGSLSVRLFVLLSRLQTQQFDTSGIMFSSFCMGKEKEKREKKNIEEREGEKRREHDRTGESN